MTREDFEWYFLNKKTLQVLADYDCYENDCERKSGFECERVFFNHTFFLWPRNVSGAKNIHQDVRRYSAVIEYQSNVLRDMPFDLDKFDVPDYPAEPSSYEGVHEIFFENFPQGYHALWELPSKCPNVENFKVCSCEEQFANDYLFTVDGVLFRYLQGTIELVAFPRNRTGAYDVPIGVSAISEMAFTYSDISEIRFPPTLTWIDENCFCSCNKLEHIFIPSTVKMIGDQGWENPFPNCSFLREIIVDPNNPNYMSYNGDLYTSEGVLLCRPAGKKEPYVRPNFCKDYGFMSFSGSSCFSDLVISGDVKLNEYTYCNCRELKSVIFKEDVLAIEGNLFVGCKDLKDVYVLNPDTAYPEWYETDGELVFEKSCQLMLHGKRGSTTEKYAKRNSNHIIFVPLD